MKTSLKWIKDLVPGLDVTPQEYTDAMILSGSKVEFYDASNIPVSATGHCSLHLTVRRAQYSGS